MNKRERIQVVLSGAQPDRLPYSLWTHLPGIDLDPIKLAEATYEFYKNYDVDFIKTMDNGMYAVEDFGCEVDFSEVASGGVSKITHSPIQTPWDWKQLQVHSCEEGALARELTSLKLLLEKVRAENVPVLFTVFSPLTIADKLSKKLVLKHIAEGYSPEVHYALNVIAETTAQLAKKAIELGADGVFFASQMSSYNVTTDNIYREYGKPYDLQVLEGAKNGWFNTIHAHGNNIMFELLRDYPVAAFNWHAWETLPTMDEAQLMTGKCLMGGLQRMDITDHHKNEIQHQIYECFKLLGGRKLILTPGCVIRYPLDSAMLAFIKEAKEFAENVFRNNGRL